MIVPLVYMWEKMTKNILITLFFSVITYAIVSDLGKPQHSYHSGNSATIAHSMLP
jgi:hypothetical protein